MEIAPDIITIELCVYVNNSIISCFESLSARYIMSNFVVRGAIFNSCACFISLINSNDYHQ